MDFVLVALLSAALGAITLVSGFGLGTVLLPAFAAIFPIEVAIAATGIVHFVNNLFKLGLVGRFASRSVVLRFGIPAVIAAAVGAGLMSLIADIPPLAVYNVAGIEARITGLKLVIAALLATFAALELSPWYRRLAFPRSMLPVGGTLSGFFGGISGMQGALRAPFLLRAGLDRDQFVGTANVISTIVDAARLAAYAAGFTWLARTRDYAVLTEPRTLWLVGFACAAACVGSVAGSRLLNKVTLHTVRFIVAALLFLAAAALGAGII